MVFFLKFLKMVLLRSTGVLAVNDGQTVLQEVFFSESLVVFLKKQKIDLGNGYEDYYFPPQKGQKRQLI